MLMKKAAKVVNVSLNGFGVFAVTSDFLHRLMCGQERIFKFIFMVFIPTSREILVDT